MKTALNIIWIAFVTGLLGIPALVLLSIWAVKWIDWMFGFNDWLTIVLEMYENRRTEARKSKDSK